MTLRDSAVQAVNTAPPLGLEIWDDSQVGALIATLLGSALMAFIFVAGNAINVRMSHRIEVIGAMLVIPATAMLCVIEFVNGGADALGRVVAVLLLINLARWLATELKERRWTYLFKAGT